MKHDTHAAPFTSSWTQLQTSIQLVRNNLEPVIILSLLPTLLTQLDALLARRHNNASPFLMLAGIAWTLINMPAVVFLQLKLSRKQTLTVGEAYAKGFPYIWRILGVMLLTGVLVTLGLVCLIVPGFMLLRRYVLAPYYVIDKNLGIVEAMKRSWEDSNKAPGYIWGTMAVSVVVSIGATLIGMIFGFIPGAPAVITSVLSLAAFFLLALRYSEIVRHNHSEASSSNS